jgi:hypothetical protein
LTLHDVRTTQFGTITVKSGSDHTGVALDRSVNNAILGDLIRLERVIVVRTRQRFVRWVSDRQKPINSTHDAMRNVECRHW